MQSAVSSTNTHHSRGATPHTTLTVPSQPSTLYSATKSSSAKKQSTTFDARPGDSSRDQRPSQQDRYLIKSFLSSTYKPVLRTGAANTRSSIAQQSMHSSSIFSGAKSSQSVMSSTSKVSAAATTSVQSGGASRVQVAIDKTMVGSSTSLFQT